MLRNISILIILLSFTTVSTDQKTGTPGTKKLKQTDTLELNINDFLGLWLKNSDDPREPRLRERKIDSAHTYFTRRKNSYKIKNSTLQQLDYKSLHGPSISTSFYHQVIPLKDRKKADQCNIGLINPVYTYKYLHEQQAIEVSCYYKVTCEFIIPVVRKNYVALYDLKTRSFLK